MRIIISIENALGALHADLWRRFVRRPWGIVLDYADADGRVFYPTSEDCEKALPNGLAWWTPIENGAFFTGLYLAGMINRREAGLGGDDEIMRLARGLFRLQDVGGTEGFIARGMADDGVSHYPCGSEDQTAPWIYGLWRLYRSSLPDEALRGELRERIMRVIRALRERGWKAPTEWSGVTAGNFSELNMRNASRLLFICRAAAELDPGAGWDAEYERLASETDGVYTRPELCSAGLDSEMISIPGLGRQFWIYLCSQATLRELCALDCDPARRAKFRTGAAVGGITALESAKALLTWYRASPDRTAAFGIDWRPLGGLWRPHRTVDEARSVASAELELWNRSIVPRRRAEHSLLTQAVFALWCAKLSPDGKTAYEAQRLLGELICETDFTSLYLPVGFSAESAYYEKIINSYGE